MHFQSMVLTFLVTSAGIAAAQYGPALHNRRDAAVLRARDAIAEIDYYDTILKRDAADEYHELFARDAEADFDYFDDLVARDEHSHFHYGRSPMGNHPSKSEGTSVDPHPPQHPKLQKCALCGTMCAAGETWHRSQVHHKGANGQCVDIPGQH